MSQWVKNTTLSTYVAQIRPLDSKLLHAVSMAPKKKLPKNSHLQRSGSGVVRQIQPTPESVFLMSLQTEFLEYIEWPGILYLGTKLLGTSSFPWK